MSHNHDLQVKKEFIERGVKIESEFRDARAERNDLMGDLKTEVKSRHDATGVEWKEVERLIKIALDEEEIRKKHVLETGDLETYEVLFGPPSSRFEDDDI